MSRFKSATRMALVIITMGVSAAASAQPGLYSIAAVPEIVRTNASVIVHSEKISMNIQSEEKATYAVSRVFTVVDESGADHLEFTQQSSSQKTLTDVEIRTYDENGKQTARYKKKDMRTVSYGDGLINDAYITYFYVPNPKYPITVELNYEVKLRNTLFLPDFELAAHKVGIVNSEYTVTMPEGFVLRHKPVLSQVKPAVTSEGRSTVYRWAVSGVAPFMREQGAPSGYSIPHVKITCDQFYYEGYKGDFSSWSSFGKWYYGLCNGLDKLSPEREEFFRNLVKDAPDEKEKVRRIYKYLQDNFRFVSISLGAGALQPMSAAFTDKQKYGDCKGLSNVTKAALNAVGIRSYLCLINRETNGEAADPAFPAWSFNHAILCVPVNKDSVWLECTSSTAEFGHLESSTENRNALIVNEQGGFLVNTPKSSAESNFIGSYTTVDVKPDLAGVMETRYQTRGDFSDMMADINTSQKDEQKRFLVYYLGYKQPDNFTIETPDRQHTILKMVIGKVPEFTSGDKLFLNQRPQKIWAEKLPKAENRKLDYFFDYPFVKLDTTVYKLPAGATLEVLPKTKKLESAYSSYNVSYAFDQATTSVTVITSLILNQHRIPAADYAEVKKFFDDVAADHTQKIVIRNTEPEKKAF